MIESKPEPMYRNIIAVVSLFLISSLFALPVQAEDIPIESRIRLYKMEKKDPFKSLLLSMFVFPGLGQIYNGDGEKAAIAVLGTLGSITVMTVGIVTSFEHEDSEFNGVGGALFTIGFIGTLGFPIWSDIDSWISAEDHNKRLRKKYGLDPLSLHVLPQGVGLSYRF